MPHSSGGGSSGGSSHSGGGSSGGSGRSTRVSDRYFPGARRYRRRNGSYFYSDGGRFGGALGSIVFGILWMAVTSSIAGDELIIKSQTKLPDVLYNDAIVIEDNQDLLSDSDEAALEAELNQFLKDTNISVAIETVEPSSVTSTLENYAYDSYVSRFDDEYHWLIVFSEKNRNETIYFEGMQGDETDPVLTAYVTTKFNKDVAQKLKETHDVKESISYGFDSMELKDGISLNTEDKSVWILFLFPVLGLVILIPAIKKLINGIGAVEE